MHRRKAFVGVIVGAASIALVAAAPASAGRFLLPWYCPPPPTAPTTNAQPECVDPFGSGAQSFDFGDRQVGTTSPGQGFVLEVYLNELTGAEVLTPEITVSGDYAQTNNCPPTLVALHGQFHACLITVTFTPTSTGPKQGALSFGPGAVPMTLSGNGVTTPTPPVLPLLFSAGASRELQAKKLFVNAITNNDSTLVARGDKIKKTKKQLAAAERTTFAVRLKHVKRLKEKPTRPKMKIEFTVTDEFGQTATDKVKVQVVGHE